jgi:hypothetical protein
MSELLPLARRATSRRAGATSRADALPISAAAACSAAWTTPGAFRAGVGAQSAHGCTSAAGADAVQYARMALSRNRAGDREKRYRCYAAQ